MGCEFLIGLMCLIGLGLVVWSLYEIVVAEGD